MKAAASIGPQRSEVFAAVALTLVVQTITSLLAACVPVIAPAIAADRRWSVTLLAFYPTILFATAFLVSFWVPRLLRWLGGMGLSVASLGISALGVGCLLSPHILVLGGAPLTSGVASASMNPASSQILRARTSAKNSALLISVKQTGVPLGGVLAGVITPILVVHWSWRIAVLQFALAGIGLAVVILPSVRWLDRSETAAPRAERKMPAPLKQLLMMPGMLPILLASFIFTAMQLCLRTFFTVHLVSNLGLSLVDAGLAFSVSQTAGMLGQVGWAAVSDRLLATRWVMALVGIFIAAAAILTAVMSAAWSFIAILLVAAVFGGSAAAFVPTVLGEVARRSSPNEVGALTSGVQPFLMAGALLGPLAFGAVTALFGFSLAFMVSAACTMVAVPLLALPPRYDVESAMRNLPRNRQ